jgi:hypothetical protein
VAALGRDRRRTTIRRCSPGGPPMPEPTDVADPTAGGASGAATSRRSPTATTSRTSPGRPATSSSSCRRRSSCVRGTGSSTSGAAPVVTSSPWPRPGCGPRGWTCPRRCSVAPARGRRRWAPRCSSSRPTRATSRRPRTVRRRDLPVRGGVLPRRRRGRTDGARPCHPRLDPPRPASRRSARAHGAPCSPDAAGLARGSADRRPRPAHADRDLGARARRTARP